MRTRWISSDGRQWYRVTVTEGELGLEAGEYTFGLDGDVVLDSDGYPITDNDYRSHAAAIRDAIASSGADQVRELLDSGGYTQREAARILGIQDRTMRYYCSGKHPVPPMVIMALMHLVECPARQS